MQRFRYALAIWASITAGLTAGFFAVAWLTAH